MSSAAVCDYASASFDSEDVLLDGVTGSASPDADAIHSSGNSLPHCCVITAADSVVSDDVPPASPVVPLPYAVAAAVADGAAGMAITAEETVGAADSASAAAAAAAASVRRKRVAAARLPRITMVRSTTATATSADGSSVYSGTAEQGSACGIASCSSDSGATVPSSSSSYDSPIYLHDEDVDSKRQRVSESSQQSDQYSLDFSDAHSDSPGGSLSDREDSPKSYTFWPTVNNAIVGGYQLVGAGKEFHAYHLDTKVVKMCQLIDNEQYRKLLKVRERLNEAGNFWKYDDLQEMREFVLPSSVEICEDEHGRRFMFTPWQYGTLNGKLQANKSALTETEAQPLFAQIVRCIAFCHACGIVVRDMKPRKFTFIDEQTTRLRLHDVFDLFVCSETENDGMRDRHSCPAYVAPEILTKGPAKYAGRPADIWALGVLLYLLLFGSYPFNDASMQRLFSRILKLRFCMPPQALVSQSARVLIYGMLRRDPCERPTAEELLYMPWIAGRAEHVLRLPVLMQTPLQFISAGSVVQPPTSISLTATVATSVRIATAVTSLSPALQLHCLLNVGMGGADDQTVPSVSPALLQLQRLKEMFAEYRSGSTSSPIPNPSSTSTVTSSPHDTDGLLLMRSPRRRPPLLPTPTSSTGFL